MADDGDYDLLIKEFDRYSALHTQNLINQDNILVQLSVGILAILGTLGKPLLVANKSLAYLVVGFLGVTILQVVIGYFISNKFFVFVKAKLNTNYEARVKPINKGLGDNIWGKTNDILNVTQSITFLLSMLFFIILLVIYIGRN